MEVVIIVSLIVTAYLLGSIPSAVWIGKRFYGVDVREHGSKNAGATNVLRVLGRRAAVPVFAIDAAKGYAAVMLSFLSPLTPYGEPFFNLRIALIVVAVAGHIFPIFAGFRGGKGVATISGCLIAMSPVPLLCSFAAFAIVFLITHYVSLGSIVAALLFPLFTFVKFYLFEREVSPTMMIFSVIVAAVLIFMHRKNFRRLKEGTESKTYLFKKR
ncbi:Acyl-phosphate:glycerol-3-phosphate O-acyltransferase PlsY [Mucinivorans hirudinis]|uniref:Glycerol-3-phosphate acyltransferase n=1 Tax=Mucinivorans hirudinis TaxID=1433126 RepID=A0A060R9D7_9BACT|nr:Acyl-phosphate:glycerol-3-phosphate O-acyltransferase PlsY [Mucinivorans hirudinis]